MGDEQSGEQRPEPQAWQPQAWQPQAWQPQAWQPQAWQSQPWHPQAWQPQPWQQGQPPAPPQAWQPGQPPAYPQQPGGYPAYAYGPQPTQQHPKATSALILGLVAVLGTFLVALPCVLGPFAWRAGSKAIREIDDEPDVWRGREQAVAGKVLGIIATLMLAGGVALAFAVVPLLMSPWS